MDRLNIAQNAVMSAMLVNDAGARASEKRQQATGTLNRDLNVLISSLAWKLDKKINLLVQQAVF